MCQYYPWYQDKEQGGLHKDVCIDGKSDSLKFDSDGVEDIDFVNRQDGLRELHFVISKIYLRGIRDRQEFMLEVDQAINQFVSATSINNRGRHS